jgi:hypothetical protein
MALGSPWSLLVSIVSLLFVVFVVFVVFGVFGVFGVFALVSINIPYAYIYLKVIKHKYTIYHVIGRMVL